MASACAWRVAPVTRRDVRCASRRCGRYAPLALRASAVAMATAVAGTSFGDPFPVDDDDNDDGASVESSASEPGAIVPEIVVVGLGPGDPGQITMQAWDILTAPGARVHVRTAQHPTLQGLPPHVTITTFDHIYERTKLLQDVYPQIAEELFAIAETVASTAAADVAGASQTEDDVFSSFVLQDDSDEVKVRLDERQRHIVYAVPGDPCVAENSVKILRQLSLARKVKVTIIPAVSFLEPTLAAVGADVMPSLCIIDAIDVAGAGHAVGITVDTPTLLCQVYSKAVASDVKLTLMQQFPEDHVVTLVHAAGTNEEIVETMPLFEIDSSDNIDILTSLFVPAVGVISHGDTESTDGDSQTANSRNIRGSVESVLDEIARARRGDVSGEAGGPSMDGNENENGNEMDDDVLDDDCDEDDDDSKWSSSSSFDSLYFDDLDSFSVFGSLDHADAAAASALRQSGIAAAIAAENDADSATRKETLGALLAALSLHVAMAAEQGEFTMADVVVEATKRVRKGII